MNNLLIITEQEQIKDSLKAILDDKFLPFSVLDPEEALRTVKEKRIDIAIIDTPLKGMPVLQFIKEMRSFGPEVIPIVLLSTSDENVREELIENKVYEWTIKPFKRKELVHLILRAEEKLQLVRKVKALEDEKRGSNLATKESLAENRDFLVGEELKRLFYYYQETFRKFSRVLTHIFEPEELFEMIVHTLGEVFEVGKLAILIKDRNDSPYYRIKRALRIKKEVVGEFKIKEGDGIAGWLSKNGQILTRRNKNIPSAIKEEMELLESAVCVPLFSNGDLLGFLSLGKKVTGEDFTYGELRFLYMMSNYTALAIQNSYLYKEIIQHRAHLSDIMQNISSGVLTIDKEGKIISINKSAQDILGIKEEVIGEDIQKAGSIVADIMLRTLHDERIYNRHEVVYPGKNISLGMSTIPLRDELNRIKGALMVFQNISEVKRVEEELNKAKEEKFWRELTSRIAHGIRNPLVSISTFAQLLPEKKGEKDFMKDYHQTVLDSVNTLNYVVNRLEKLSDASKITLSKGNINSTLEEVIEEFKEEFKKQNIYVKKNIANYIPTSLIDNDKMKEVFSNFIKNSLSAMHDGGKLDIETSYDPTSKGIRVILKDNGKGIGYEDMSKLYSPFFTTETKGLGLGLPIAKQIIEKHGGKSRISSTPKKGTTVEIFLPVIIDEKEEVSVQIPKPESVAVASPVEKTAPPSLKKGRLSLEEEVANMEKRLITEALKKSGGVKVKAAKLLNISRRMLAYKIEKLGIK
jgi:PAS domain S-box-containing protein